MGIQRMDNVAIVVRDLDGAVDFFTDLGMELEGRTAIEGHFADQTVGIDGIRSEIAMMRTQDGHGRVELTTYHSPDLITPDPLAPAPNTVGLHRIMFAVEDASDPHAQHEASSNDLSIRQVDDLTQLEVEPTKVLFVGEREITDPLLDELSQSYGDHLELAYSSPLYLEATAAGVDKGSAITDYCRAQGIPLSRVMAFGDNGNDIGMLRTAGLGIAMGNGIPEAKAAADMVTTSNDDEGIARVLSRYFDMDTSDIPE